MSLSDRDPALVDAQAKIMATAKKLADRQARMELLADDGEFSLVRRLAILQNTTVAVLRGDWKPFRIDKNADSGFGFSLRPDNPLVLEILKDAGLLDRVNEIAVQAVFDAIATHDQIFVETLLNDIFSRDSFYQEEERDDPAAS